MNVDIELEWYAYNYNFNQKKLEIVNIFRYGNFEENVKKLLKKHKKLDDKEAFAEELRIELSCLFWSRCEYEIVLTRTDEGRIIMSPWVGDYSVTLDVTCCEWFDFVGFFEKEYEKHGRHHNKTRLKVDLYDQVRYKWNEFVEYVWNYK